MCVSGKFVFTFDMDNKSTKRTLLLRNYYDGSWHGTLLDDQGKSVIVSNLKAQDNDICFTAKEPGQLLDVNLYINTDKVTGTVAYGQPNSDKTSVKAEGTVSEITASDDRAEKIQMKKKALIIYASITGNTEKIAKAFQRSFEHYGFTVDICKVTNKTEHVPHNYHDYDVVCMGSLIIAGAPTAAMIKRFSLGGGSDLESNVTKNAESGLDFNAGGGALNAPKGPEGESGMPPMGPGGPGSDTGPGAVGGGVSYAGGPAPHGTYHPLGIVFTTYGGGFYGSNEAMATLETLKLYLELSSVQVVGKFACCGKEFGPAGLADGVKPTIMGGGEIDDPVYYIDADGKYHAGSYFFHTHMNSKPCDRDIMKAEALVADLVEDYFYSHDGIRKDVASQYISIS